MRAHRLFASALGAVVILMGSVGLPGTASATVSVACPFGHLCVYKDANFAGDMFPFVGSDGFWGNNSQGEGFIDDEASSLDSTLDDTTTSVWQDAGETGPLIACLGPFDTRSSLGSDNDEASSDKFGNCSPGTN